MYRTINVRYRVCTRKLVSRCLAQLKRMSQIVVFTLSHEKKQSMDFLVLVGSKVIYCTCDVISVNR